MKLYLIKITYKQDDNIQFYKIGITSKTVHERFGAELFASNKKWDEFKIEELMSIDDDDQFVKDLEYRLQGIFKKNFILENLIRKPFGYYNGLSGITEIFKSESSVDEIKGFIYTTASQLKGQTKHPTQPSNKANYYITNYLGIEKGYFDSHDGLGVVIGGENIYLDTEMLRGIKHYTDDKTHYRWLLKTVMNNIGV